LYFLEYDIVNGEAFPIPAGKADSLFVVASDLEFYSSYDEDIAPEDAVSIFDAKFRRLDFVVDKVHVIEMKFSRIPPTSNEKVVLERMAT